MPSEEIYWDIQVDGTHNYVTIDGAIHHNSTKTTAGIIKIAYMAKQVAPCIDGIRRSRCAVVRNTRQMLLDTTVPDFLKWFPDGEAGIFEKTATKFLLKFDDVECEVLFRGLDEPNDVRRLLSLQLSFAVIDEFREIHKDIYEALAGRLGRYPDGALVPHRPEWGLTDKGDPVMGCVDDEGRSMKMMWGMSNPPDLDTFWEEILTDPPANAHITIQPSGVSPEADWVKFLPPGYYEDLMELHAGDPDWIDVYVHAKFGKTLGGRPVWECFNRETHVSKDSLIVLPAPLIIGVDAGLNPSAVIGQQTYDNRLAVHDALTGHAGGMGALRFIREILKPKLAAKYPGRGAFVSIDPAAFTRAQTDERTVADIFKNEGFHVKPAATNAIAGRLAAVEGFLTRTINGKTAMILDKDGCPLLIKAMAGKYRYKINKNGEKDDTPEKSHPWSDISDALQYLCLAAGGGVVFGRSMQPQVRVVEDAPMRWAS